MKMVQPAEPVEKELTLLVNEGGRRDWNMDMPEDMDVSGQTDSVAGNIKCASGIAGEVWSWRLLLQQWYLQ